MDRRILAGLIIALVVVVAIIFARSYQQPGVVGIGADKNKIKGAAFPKVRIVEYSDFQCPACKRAYPVLKEFLEKYSGKIQVSYRHFPLAGHRWAKLAHQAAECAARQGQFWPYHDRLYEEQEKWSYQEDPAPIFLQYAQDLDLNMEKFGTCMADEKVTQAIFEEKEQGTRLQVASTPTFFIQDKRFVGVTELSTGGEALIREELGLEPNP